MTNLEGDSEIGAGVPPWISRDLFGNPVTQEARSRQTKANGYARPPGSGPAGQTCGTCAHLCRVNGGTRNYPKCFIVRHRWTSGPGTDIKTKSPACEMWETKPCS